MKSGNINSDEAEEDFENEPLLSHSIHHVWLEDPVPDKLYFLATGKGCGTVEVINAFIG